MVTAAWNEMAIADLCRNQFQGLEPGQVLF
jgi:hypothetical protein